MTNDDERAQILRMVSEGQLSPQEAANLLEAIEPAPAEHDPIPPIPPMPAMTPMTPMQPVTPENPIAAGRNLVIHIEDKDTSVHLRIPLGLARAAQRFVPRQAQNHLNEYGISLEEILSDLANVSTQGPLVQIEDKDTQVRIAVE